jgi:hypothetical protein
MKKLLRRLGPLAFVPVALVAALTAFFALAGAAAPTQGSSVPSSAVAVSPFTAGIPFSSGQLINVVVPANSLFLSTSSVNSLECAAPDGILPTLPTQCDGNTIQGPTVLPNTDGSINLEEQGYGLYQVFALPDSVDLGENSTNEVKCGNTSATECVLYIGDNQGDFTAPHVFSQPFYVEADADDLGTDPGDGLAPAVPTAPSAALSTVAASPATVTADGADESTVTVTLLGAGNVPVPGKEVVLSQGTGKSTIIAAATPTMTNANGVASFTVTDSTVETVTYTAEDVSDTPTVTVSGTATVDFAAPVVDAQNSSVSSSLATVPSGQSDTITVTLRDQASNPQPVAGQSVSLSGTGAVQITPKTDVTNTSGVATFSVSDTNDEVVTFAATDTTASIALTPISVTFGAIAISPSLSTVTAANPVAEVGASGGTSVIVTLLTSGGSPVPDTTVALATSSPTASIRPATLTTNMNGVASFTVTDPVAESVTFTATDTTVSPNILIAATALVQFETPAVSATASVVTANGGTTTTSVADGETQTLVRVVLKDQFGNPVPGANVTLLVTGSAVVLPHPSGSTPPGTTNPAGSNNPGEADFLVDDEAAETVAVRAVDTSVTPNVDVVQGATIDYVAGPADPFSATSTVVASNANPPSDGTTPTTLTVTLTDEFGNPVSGQGIILTALPSGNSAVIRPESTATNAAGVATFTATDATAEEVTFQATDTTDGNTPFTSEAVVRFGQPSSVPVPSATTSDVALSRMTSPADGHTETLVVVTVNDQYDNPLSGKIVTLQVNPVGAAQIGSVAVDGSTPGVTNDSGIAEFEVTDATVQVVTYTAIDTTDNLTLAEHPTESFQTPVTPPAATPEAPHVLMLGGAGIAALGAATAIARRRRRNSGLSA